MDRIGQLPARKPGPYLRARKFLKIFRGDKAGIEDSQAPDAAGECHDEALTELFQFSCSHLRAHFLQDFKHIWYSVLQAGPA